MKKKSIIAIILSFALCILMLAGCSGDSTTTDDSSTTTAETADEGSTSAETIKIGLLAPLTGDVAKVLQHSTAPNSI